VLLFDRVIFYFFTFWLFYVFFCLCLTALSLSDMGQFELTLRVKLLYLVSLTRECKLLNVICKRLSPKGQCEAIIP
jgi:hypothetical protein